MKVKQLRIGILFCMLVFGTAKAQQYLDPEYIKVTQERAAKIVKGLELNDTSKQAEVTDIIAKQYQNLTKLQDERDAEVEAVKKSRLAEEKQNQKIEKIKSESDKDIAKLHDNYVKQLSQHLNEEQIDGVKDGMTYGVFPKTYVSYLDMIPSLTKEEKQYVYDNLKEAREHAMDGGSSHEKHWWFGKYKGRINNYLSSRGYDLEKEREGWYKRIEEAKQK